MIGATIIDNTTNRVVVHVPGRNYPGIVVQGDTLRLLRIMAESDNPLEREELKRTLVELENHYSEVCSKPMICDKCGLECSVCHTEPELCIIALKKKIEELQRKHDFYIEACAAHQRHIDELQEELQEQLKRS